MRIGDIYKHKENKTIIQIDSFATHMGEQSKKRIIVFRIIEIFNKYKMYTHPDLSGFGTQEEIESMYDLVIKEKDIDSSSEWNDIIETNKLYD